MSSESEIPKAQEVIPEEGGKKEEAVFKEPAAPKAMEMEQEAKLKAKYPGLRGPGSNPLLQKRLLKGQKYFDSGDYNMAKQNKGRPQVPGSQRVLLGGVGGTGQAHPTPETVPARKTSLIP